MNCFIVFSFLIIVSSVFSPIFLIKLILPSTGFKPTGANIPVFTAVTGKSPPTISTPFDTLIALVDTCFSPTVATVLINVMPVNPASVSLNVPLVLISALASGKFLGFATYLK